MAVRLHSHARARSIERGATEEEIIAAVETGEMSPAAHGRTRFRRNFMYNDLWQGKRYATKQVEAIVVRENSDWLVVTVVTRFF